MARAKTYEREQALDKAMKAFWRSGYSATSMRLLLAATGLAAKSLYTDFGGKDALFIEVLDRYIAVQEGLYAESLGTAPLGIDRVRSHLGSYRFTRQFQGCLLVNALGERAQLPGTAIHRIDRFFDRVRALYQANLEHARRLGLLPDDADLAGLAEALLVFDQGLAIAGKSPRQREHLRAAADALLDRIAGAKSPMLGQ
jgi:TetR/AcrR family transcriptional regulator, transcriptional repressor for nem operon